MGESQPKYYKSLMSTLVSSQVVWSKRQCIVAKYIYIPRGFELSYLKPKIYI